MEADQQLLPCPFCGAAAEYVFSDPGAPYPGGYATVYCSNEENCMSDCFHSEPKCLSKDEKEMKEKAINKWNKRVNPEADALRAELKEEKEESGEYYARYKIAREERDEVAAERDKLLVEKAELLSFLVNIKDSRVFCEDSMDIDDYAHFERARLLKKYGSP